MVNILPGMNAGASTYAVPSPIKGSGTAWVLLGSWALSPARPTPIHPRHECRGLSALFGEKRRGAVRGPHLPPPMDHAVGPHQGAVSRVNRGQAFLLRGHGRPHPLGRPLQ